MLEIISKKFNTWQAILQTLVGSFIISSGWNWYHLSHRLQGRFIFFVFITTIIIWIGYYIGKWLYHFITKRFNRHIFWQKQFGAFLDNLFFTFSLFFIVFFSNNQLLSLIIFLILLGLFFYKIQIYISHHPAAGEWKVVHRHISILTSFLFILFAVWQYSAFRLANFDAYFKFHNIVLFRAWAMTMFLMLGFAVATLIYWKVKNFWRYLALALWAVVFIFILVLWTINIGVMYFHGLYIIPAMLEIASGSAGVALNWLTLLTVGGAVITLLGFVYIFREIIRSYGRSSFKQWAAYSLAIIAVALLSLFGLSSFKNTPEFTIVKNFYRYFLGKKEIVVLSPVVKEKLERFGLFYDVDNFTITRRDKVFNLPATILPNQFSKTKPNIIVIFFESFSSRLTSVYNKSLAEITPGLEEMAADSSTIIFNNYYNASTPTINGILAQLCSFLPPTGYTEIEVNKNLQRLRLLCLPEMLKKSGGYKSATYITAVNKEFENKDAIFASMDTDSIYGQQELRSIISGEPLSWGYSDHQLFPAMWKLIQEKSPEPFLMMLSTVDTHPPFDLAKDMIPYGDGKNNVFNSYHTADDAFGKWWQQFKESKFYNNTIVVAVADHAAFPGADIKRLFSDGDTLSFYDKNMFMVYLPNGALAKVNTPRYGLPKEVNTLASSIDVIPTLLHVLNINVPNTLEGHSIFDNKSAYPNILGMHEYGLYINQEVDGSRKIDDQVPSQLNCKSADYSAVTSSALTPCEYLEFYNWKRQMFEQGRFWGK